MAMEGRPLGIVIALVGAAGTAIAALADPLGIGEGEVFGWLQITGVIIGAAVTLIGLALAMEWVPYPGRSRSTTGVTQGGQNTTVVRDRDTKPEERTAP
jgi:predicted MFS family arabinose efflux permease